MWKHCIRVLIPGGRLVCVAGEVCLSRRKHGRHSAIPMHAGTIVRARNIGFDNLTFILWHKITNANYEVENGSGVRLHGPGAVTAPNPSRAPNTPNSRPTQVQREPSHHTFFFAILSRAKLAVSTFASIPK